jgi:CheY-specific phosphatase CheX
MRKPEEIFHQTLRDACDSLFESMPLNVLAAVGRDRSCELNEQQLASMIGFAGPHVRGSLLVRAPISFFSGTYPKLQKEGPHGMREVSDWAGEVANQLLGRLKNQLLRHGLAFSVATPATVFGAFLQEGIPAEGSLTLRFPWQEDEISVRFDVSFDGAALISEEPAAECVPLAAGDALLF